MAFSFGAGDFLLFRSFRCRGAAQQTFSAEVFVEIRPVDTVAAAGNLPVVALRGRGIEQARMHTTGTEITRPSRKETLSASSLNATSKTRSSAAAAEKLIPGLQKLRPAFAHKRLYLASCERETQN